MPTEPSSAPYRAQRAAGVSRNIDPGGPTGCFICQGKLFVQFFFDDFGRSRDEDKSKGMLSNISKLYYAAVDDPERGIYSYYIPGPGTNLKESVDLSKVMQSRAEGELKSAPMNAVGEVGAKLGENTIDHGNPAKGLFSAKSLKGGLMGVLVEGAMGWAADSIPIVRDIKPLAHFAQTGYDARLVRALQNLQQTVAAQTLRITEIHLAIYGAGRGGILARAFVNQLIGQQKMPKYPTANGKVPLVFRFMGLFDSQGTLGKRTGMGIPMVRNDAGDIFELGVPGAVEVCVHLAAAHEFSYQKPVHSIGRLDTVSLDWLEDQARRCDWIVESSTLVRNMEDAEIKRKNAQGLDSPPNASELLHPDTDIEKFKQTADELRIRAMALRMTGGTRVEKLFAGSAANVIGGDYPDGHGGKSNELAKLALREMQRQSYMFGCPMKSIEQLKRDGSNLVDLFELIPLHKAKNKTITIEDLHGEYMKELSDTLRVISLEDHAIKFMHWLHHRMIEFDRLGSEQRKKMHEVVEGITQGVMLALKEYRGDPVTHTLPQPQALHQQRICRAFDEGGEVSPLIKIMFDYFVYTPWDSNFFYARSIDVTEDKSTEGKAWETSRTKEDDAEVNRRNKLELRKKNDESHRVFQQTEADRKKVNAPEPATSGVPAFGWEDLGRQMH